MNDEAIRFKLKKKNTKPPRYMHESKEIVEFYSPVNFTIAPNSKELFRFEIEIEVPQGKGGYLTWKYREGQKVRLIEMSVDDLKVHMINNTESPIKIEKGEKVAEFRPMILTAK